MDRGLNQNPLDSKTGVGGEGYYQFPTASGRLVLRQSWLKLRDEKGPTSM